MTYDIRMTESILILTKRFVFYPASHRFISYFVQLSHSFKQVYKLHFMYQSITITKSFVSEFKMFAGDGKGQNLTLILKRCIMRPSLER